MSKKIATDRYFNYLMKGTRQLWPLLLSQVNVHDRPHATCVQRISTTRLKTRHDRGYCSDVDSAGINGTIELLEDADRHAQKYRHEY